MFLLGASMFGMWFFVSLYLQQVLGYSPLSAGLAFLPMTLSIVLGSAFASRGVSRLGAKPLLVVGMTLQAAGMLLFTGISAQGSYAGDVLVPSLVVAIGMGLAFVPVTIAAVAGVRSEEAGLASGLVNTSRLMGGALGLAILATVAGSSTAHHLAGRHATGVTLHQALTSGYHSAFAVGAAFAAIGALTALVLVPSVRRAPTRGAGEPAASEAHS